MFTYICINWGSCVFHFRREHTETSHGCGIGISSNWIWLPFLLAISGMAQPQKRHFDVRPHSKHKSWSIPYLVLNRTTSYRIHIKFLKYSSCLLEAIDWIFFYYYYQNATPLNISQTLNYLDKYIIYFVLLHCAGIPPLFIWRLKCWQHNFELQCSLRHIQMHEGIGFSLRGMNTSSPHCRTSIWSFQTSANVHFTYSDVFPIEFRSHLSLYWNMCVNIKPQIYHDWAVLINHQYHIYIV